MAVIFNSLALDMLVFLVTGAYALYWYFTRNFHFWKSRGVPYIRPLPFLGSMKEVALQRVSIGQYLKGVYDEHRDKPYIGIFAFHQPALVVHDLDLIKNILVKEHQVFVNHKIQVDQIKDPLIHRGVFALKGQRWKHMRTNLSPTFTSGKMKAMFCLVDKCAKELVTFIDAAPQPVRVKDTMARFTTDVVASCAFGLETNSLKNLDAEFRRILSPIFNFTASQSLAGFLSFFATDLAKVFRLQIIDNKVTDFIRNSIWSTIEYRQKNGIVRKDFLDNMIELRKKTMNPDGTKKATTGSNDIITPILEDDDFVAQAFSFLTAGFETSSTTMSFALYELALEPEVQNRLRAEISEVLEQHNQEVTYEGIQQMTYLDMVVSETLRKYPVLPFLDRESVTDYKLPGKGSVTLPAGTAVYIPLIAIQQDPEYFPDPQRFDPERFTEENKKQRPAFTYFPFGEGPRVCIGMRFGLMQAKAGLIHILSHYEVSPTRDTPRSLVYDPKSFLLQTQGELLLDFARVAT